MKPYKTPVHNTLHLYDIEMQGKKGHSTKNEKISILGESLEDALKQARAWGMSQIVMDYHQYTDHVETPTSIEILDVKLVRTNVILPK